MIVISSQDPCLSDPSFVHLGERSDRKVGCPTGTSYTATTTGRHGPNPIPCNLVCGPDHFQDLTTFRPVDPTSRWRSNHTPISSVEWRDLDRQGPTSFNFRPNTTPTRDTQPPDRLRLYHRRHNKKRGRRLH